MVFQKGARGHCALASVPAASAIPVFTRICHVDSRFRGNDGAESGNGGAESGNGGVEGGNGGAIIVPIPAQYQRALAGLAVGRIIRARRGQRRLRGSRAPALPSRALDVV